MSHEEPTERTVRGQTLDWSDTVKKEAEGSNGTDLGEIQDVGNTYVRTKKGLLNKKEYFLPKYLAEGYDGDKVYFRISQDDADNLFSNEENVPPADEDYRTKYRDENPARDTLAEDIEQRIAVMGERLHASKTQTQDEVRVVKEPVTETETVEVPVTHEELVVERRPATGDTPTSGEGPVTSEQEVRVPLMEEHVKVTKEPYVKEEVVLGKKQVTETEKVTDKVRSEKVKVKDDKD
jgi:uncharacterized protein (TIGR02271 family)